MNKLLQTLKGEKSWPPPLWLMRQAGRYLPEYLAIRRRFPEFMELCFDQKAIVDVTLQPIQRFDFDAAIIFSDILIIPHILGQKVGFKKDHGPVLETIQWGSFFESTEDIDFEHHVDSILKAIQNVRIHLSSSKSLIGFAGSPWTIATYMVSRGKTHDFQNVLNFATTQKDYFARLLQLLTQRVILWLQMQIDNGCDVVQIFDSWAGVVPEDQHDAFLLKPFQDIVEALRLSHANVPIIYFGRGMGHQYPFLSNHFKDITWSVDQQTDIVWIHEKLNDQITLQGNLAPELLRMGHMEQATSKILKIAKERPLVFNLGHGILPDTPIKHVEHLIDLVRTK